MQPASQRIWLGPRGMRKARANKKASNRTRQAPCVVDVPLRSRSDYPCLSLAGYLASPSSSKENHNAGNRRPVVLASWRW